MVPRPTSAQEYAGRRASSSFIFFSYYKWCSHLLRQAFGASMTLLSDLQPPAPSEQWPFLTLNLPRTPELKDIHSILHCFQHHASNTSMALLKHTFGLCCPCKQHYNSPTISWLRYSCALHRGHYIEPSDTLHHTQCPLLPLPLLSFNCTPTLTYSRVLRLSYITSWPSEEPPARHYPPMMHPKTYYHSLLHFSDFNAS